MSDLSAHIAAKSNTVSLLATAWRLDRLGFALAAALGARRAQRLAPVWPARHLPALARAAGPAQAAQLRHQHQRLDGDRQRHLAVTRRAVAEADRDLGDPESGQQGAVGQLDVEDVALRAER